MPGQLEIRLPQAHGGKTPAKSVLTWVERALEITEEQHQLQGARKPYAVYAIQRGRDVLARITVATPDQLSRLCLAARERMSFNGDWAYPETMRADFVPVEMLLSSAPPRTRIRITTETPVVFCQNGKDDPILTKQRLFMSGRERWEQLEASPPSFFSPTEDAEVLFVSGRSVPHYGFQTHRGWEGVMELQLHGPAERLVTANALLAYAEMWGIGKGTTVGAGQIQVRSAGAQR